MWLAEPKFIQRVIVERPLECVTEEAVAHAEHELRGGGRWGKGDMQSALRSMPVVSIGQPESWPLGELYSPRRMPRALRAKAAEADFYLVRLSCSFRPIHQDSRVQWARFRVALLPHSATGQQPIAHDLYPHRVVQEIKRQTTITLSPLLKFLEVELSPGSLEFGIEYTEQQPLISAAIGTGYDPSWDFQAQKRMEVQGTKWMYLLIKAPKGLSAGRGILDLEADVETSGVLLPAVVLRRQEQAQPQQLVTQLWGEVTH